MSKLGFYREAAEGMLQDLDVEPENHATLLAELETAMGDAALEAGYEVIREHGLGWVLEGRQQPLATAPYSSEATPNA